MELYLTLNNSRNLSASTETRYFQTKNWETFDSNSTRATYQSVGKESISVFMECERVGTHQVDRAFYSNRKE
jgi:hypothetical protein